MSALMDSTLDPKIPPSPVRVCDRDHRGFSDEKGRISLVVQRVTLKITHIFSHFNTLSNQSDIISVVWQFGSGDVIREHTY